MATQKNKLHSWKPLVSLGKEKLSACRNCDCKRLEKFGANKSKFKYGVEIIYRVVGGICSYNRPRCLNVNQREIFANYVRDDFYEDPEFDIDSIDEFIEKVRIIKNKLEKPPIIKEGGNPIFYPVNEFVSLEFNTNGKWFNKQN